MKYMLMFWDEESSAAIVRVRDGETMVSDGPYAETKEQVPAGQHGHGRGGAAGGLPW
jgi:hypothetical protein